MTQLRRRLILILGVGWLLTLNACSGRRQDQPSPPATPTGLTAEPGNTVVALSWNPNTEPSLQNYTLYWGTDSENLTQTTVVRAPTTSFTVTDLTNDIPHFFSVDAENRAGQRSQRSEVISATPSAALETPLTVITTHPINGATDVALNTAVTVTFSRPMNRLATEEALRFNPDMSCSFSWSFNATTLSCQPTNPMTANISYTGTISTEAQDSAGNYLQTPFSFSFSTGERLLETCTFGESTFNNCNFGP